MSLSHKISRVLLAMLLLVSTNGFTLSKHYCMGILKSVEVEVSGHESASDACGGMEMMMECCDDEHTHLKVDDLSNSLSDFNFELTLPFPEFSTPPEILFIEQQTIALEYPEFPPPDDGLDIHIVNQVFRI